MLRQVDAPAGFERLYDLRQPEIGLRAFVAIHSTSRGPAFGGIRRRAYASPEAAREEVLGLAESMSLKCALAGLDAGGAKTVVLDRAGLDLDAAYDALGRAVQSLGGAYVCGPDLGTSASNLDRIRAHTRWVNPAENEAGPSTARGVVAALRGALQATGSEPDFAGLRVGIEGLGSVGGAVAKVLLAGGARVFGFDPDEGSARAAKGEGVELAVAADALRELPLDVWMPCALGHSITSELAASLQTRIICGSANNQLAHAGVDELLFDAGIVWVPDFLASVGAVAEGVITVAEGQGPGARARVDACLREVAETSERLLRDAKELGRPTGALAEELARSRLATR
jgi:glutamate dehydrogenase/leucine dehydrogenase